MPKEKAIIRKDISKSKQTLMEMKKHWVGYAMVFPFFLLFFMFTVVPVIISLVLSFTTFDLLQWPKWVFMDNYIRLLLEDDIFLLAIKNTLVFATATGPVSYLLCLFFAWFINELRPRVRAWVTVLYYAPSLSGGTYLLWSLFFSGDQYGYANAYLLKYDIIQKPILWFQDEKYIFTLVICVALYSSLGTSFLTLIAGYQTIDPGLYEAGAVDGIRNRWQELWFVTLPTMRPQMMLSAVLAITSSFGFGGIITALVGFPSPNYVAHTIMHHLDDYGGGRFEMGYASAIATVLFFMMIGANLLVTKLLRKVGT